MKRTFLFGAVAVVFGGASLYASGMCDGHGKPAAEKKACCAPKTTEEKETPTMSDLRTITKDELASLIQNGGVTIFDARSADQFAAGHVDGAVLYAKASLPEDKSATLVFYCGGVKCAAATKAAKKALEAGYANVLVFRGGWSEWNTNG